MKITWRIDGGFAPMPGLNRPRTVDLDALPARRARSLREVVERALDAPAPAAKTARGADRRTLRVQVEEDDGRTRQLAILEPAADPAHAELTEALRALPD